MNERLFRDAMGKFATGITIVTIDDNGEEKGMTVNAFMSISLNPKLIAISIDKGAGLYNQLMKTEQFGVSVLKEEQKDLSMIFAKQKEQDRPIPYGQLNNVPIIKEALVALSCDVYKRVDAGDHTIILGEVSNLQLEDGNPVLYFGGSYRQIREL